METEKDVIEIHQVSPKIFSSILSFIYTGRQILCSMWPLVSS